MTDTSQTDELLPQSNGIADSTDDDERAKMRPVDIDADVREMERRKRVELIMSSKLFREELERIIETQLKDGTGPSGLLQQISDMVGVNKQSGNVFKNSSCVIPINDIRGIEAMGYAKGEKILRCKLAAVFRLIDLYGWTQGVNTLVTARLNQDDEQFLVNPYGMLFHEITASSLIKSDMQGGVLEQGTTNFSVNISAFSLHAAVHAARPDIKCVIHVRTPSVVAISSLKQGLLPLSQESVVIGEVSTHSYLGGLLDADEKDKLARNLGPINKVLLLTNQGALCCGQTIEEAFFNARNTVLASESQLKVLPLGLDNLMLLSDESKKKIYESAHKAPESSPRPDQPSILEGKVERKWRVGGVEFEALMRMLDNAGFRTGYIYRHPLVKGEPPRPKNDVEVPPAVSSLGYLLEEEELYRQGLWRKLEGGRKGNDRSRWLNSPNVYQKVEILETGTPDPKKITKWVADGSPSHPTSTPVKIDSALQFVPKGTNPKEFKQKQQQIKDYRRADKISAGPQSHILEGVTWEEAKKMQDATVTETGDQVVLMGAASKGIIQRGHQHNAMVYKSPYAKNPFDSVTDEELDEYKKVVEKKVKGEYDTDFSESEGLSSAQINKRLDGIHLRSPTSATSETEEESKDEPQILRIETKTAPRPSQPEVVLSDAEFSPVEQFLKAERVSANNFKSHNVIEVPLNGINTSLMHSYYRTNSHAGLPKGSYILPNPIHFHVTYKHEIAKAMRPTIVSYAPHSESSRFNIRSTHKSQKSAVTISLSDTHSVSVDVSIDTLRKFIFPFTNALNLLAMPVLNNQSCQTTYRSNIHHITPNTDRSLIKYTPLYVSTHSNTLQTQINQTNSVERRILNDMQKNLLEHFDSSISESDVTDCDVNEELNIDDINEFNEQGSFEANESLIEITPEIASILAQSTTSSGSTVSSSLPESQNLVTDFGQGSTEVDTNFKSLLYQAEISENKHGLIDNSIPEICKQNDTESPDEGIEESVYHLSPNISDNYPNHIKDQIFDERVEKLSVIITDYLIQEGFEIRELLLFPEILSDQNVMKLLENLTDTYKKLYSECPTNEEKNELRLSMAACVLKLLELDERWKDESRESNSNYISDKLFSISEFVSDILDQFFDNLNKAENPNVENYVEVFSDFTENLVEQGSDAYSTPEVAPEYLDLDLNSNCRKKLFIYDQSVNCNTENNKEYTENTLENIRQPDIGISDCKEVRAFKKTKKTQGETYWITVTDTSDKSVPILTKKSTIKNIDEIPLKPPTELNKVNSQCNRKLYTILEEPRVNLFDSHLGTDIVDISRSFSEEYEIIDESDDSSEQTNNNIDLNGSDETESYISFAQPEVNVVVCDSVTFCRTKTVNSHHFIKSSNVVLKTKCDRTISEFDDNKENEPVNDSGDWMGYESARF